MKSTVEMSMPNITVKSYYYRRSTANKASVLKKKIENSCKYQQLLSCNVAHTAVKIS